MDRIFDGVKRFSSSDFEEYREHFDSIGRGQKPHTLFIGCSDSRVVPNLITNTLPGELFVVRNIANIVPIYREVNEFLATTAAIEYAVKALEVSNIVVCGHSNCGGCAAFYLDDAELKALPHTRKWIQLSRNVAEAIRGDPETMADVGRREWMTEQLNVVEQLDHLLTYPYIAERHEAGQLKIYGWYYVIPTGAIYDYHRESGTFRRIE